MCFHSAHILSCVRVFHISHTLVNHYWTVVTQRTNSKHVCFQFGRAGPAKAAAASETTPQCKFTDLIMCWNCGITCSAPVTLGLAAHTYAPGEGVEGEWMSRGSCGLGYKPLTLNHWWSVSRETSQSLKRCKNGEHAILFVCLSQL